VLNYAVKQKNIRENEIEMQNTTYYFTNNSKIKTTKSNKDVDIKNTLVYQFINTCIDKKLEDAYSILSKNSKTLYFSTLDEFEVKYYNEFIKNKKLYSINIETESEFLVTMQTDILSTGDVELRTYEHFIALVNEDGQEKVEINL
jgi:hypothetical protein